MASSVLVVPHPASEAKVRYLDRTPVVYEHVRWFQVAVKNPLAVEKRHSLEKLAHDLAHVPLRENLRRPNDVVQ
eukprot:11175354-Prorocentrum_lima.AAC.1